VNTLIRSSLAQRSGGGGGGRADIKSNPHLTGGEKNEAFDNKFQSFGIQKKTRKRRKGRRWKRNKSPKCLTQTFRANDAQKITHYTASIALQFLGSLASPVPPSTSFQPGD